MSFSAYIIISFVVMHVFTWNCRGMVVLDSHIYFGIISEPNNRAQGIKNWFINVAFFYLSPNNSLVCLSLANWLITFLGLVCVITSSLMGFTLKIMRPRRSAQVPISKLNMETTSRSSSPNYPLLFPPKKPSSVATKIGIHLLNLSKICGHIPRLWI